MRVLVTGATGFIGSELVKRLKERDHEVFSLVRYTAGGRYDYYGRKDVVIADLRDRETLEQIVIQLNPEVIFHLAAQSAVSYSFQNPVDVASTNYLGTIALVQAARNCPRLKLFVHASTSEVYAHATVFPTPEDSPLGATSPYACSKIAAEEFLRVSHQSYDFPALIMRPFNTYGRALVGNSHFVVERAIVQALTTQHIQLHDSRPLREFIFRDDHVRGYQLVMDAIQAGVDLSGETINLASGRAVSIAEMTLPIIDKVSHLLHKEVKASFQATPDRPLDIPKLEGANKKAMQLLRWKPEYWIFPSYDEQHLYDPSKDGIAKAVEEWACVLKISPSSP